MRFTVFAQVYSIAVIISLGETRRVKSKLPGEVTPNTPVEDMTYLLPGEAKSHSPESAKPNDSVRVFTQKYDKYFNQNKHIKPYK